MGPSQEKICALEKKMKDLGISKADIQEKFIKASGRGGQKVNKSSSAVFLRHTKTNLTVKCQTSRSLNLNRFLALRRLVEKIEASQDSDCLNHSAQSDRIERVKKQKQRRKKRNAQKLATKNQE